MVTNVSGVAAAALLGAREVAREAPTRHRFETWVGVKVSECHHSVKVSGCRHGVKVGGWRHDCFQWPIALGEPTS